MKILRSATINLTVTDAYGCAGNDSVYVAAESCCDLGMPNAFTPNGDGRNDVFRIITIGNSEILSFRILNRWGQTIWESLNGSDSWDGSFMNKPQPAGNYFYFVSYRCANGNVMEKKGDVTLLR